MGLIPARAGKTLQPARCAYPASAHPRAGGENIQGFINGIRSMGSSPRGRGKRVSLKSSRPRRRLIPARAGKTRSAAESRLRRAAHPRAGGENRPLTPRASALAGSSPRGRGKLRARDLQSGVRRLIPARAGKTPARQERRASARAHPRAGGENDDLMTKIWPEEGSSPRGRGKPGRPHF